MAYRLQCNLRQEDFIARFGGDEFAVIIQNIKHTDHLITICENLLASSKNPIIHLEKEIYFSFSIGIALGSSSNTPEALISEADNAMYKAKMLDRHWFISS